jgi:hypothetical protein
METIGPHLSTIPVLCAPSQVPCPTRGQPGRRKAIHHRSVRTITYRRWVLEHFSGTLCVNEWHLGRTTLLLATDPLQDLPVAFALVSSNDTGHMRRFLKNLEDWGLRDTRRGPAPLTLPEER